MNYPLQVTLECRRHRDQFTLSELLPRKALVKKTLEQHYQSPRP